MEKYCYAINTRDLGVEYLLKRIDVGIQQLKGKISDGKLSIECGSYAANQLKMHSNDPHIYHSPSDMSLMVFGVKIDINTDLQPELLIITIKGISHVWLSTTMYKRPFFEEFIPDKLISDKLRLQEESVRKELMELDNLQKWKKMQIKNVIFNDPATIVLWCDGTKTVVKCQDGETFDKEKGLAMALVKKACGNAGNFNELFKKWC